MEFNFGMIGDVNFGMIGIVDFDFDFGVMGPSTLTLARSVH